MSSTRTGPPTGSCTFCPCCKPHKLGDDINFLTWHRLFNYQMEWAMQEHDSSFTIPYWDWTTTNVLPSFWLSGPLNGLTSVCPPFPTNTQRNYSPFSVSSQANLVNVAFQKRNLLAFSEQIISPHNNIHVAMGCDMGTVGQASYDPIFFMHHAYVDYQFAYWQELQAIYGYPPFDPTDAADMDLNLEPFNRVSNPSLRSLRNCQGKNTFDYRNNFCYEYDELLFQGQTPAQFTTPSTTAGPGRRKRSAVQNGLTPLEFALNEMEKDKNNRVFIGVSMRATGISSQQTVTMCKEDQCVEVVKLSTFGTRQEPVYEEQIKSPYLVQYEVTELVQSLGWPTFDIGIKATITSYNDQDGNALPLDKTYLPVFLWRFADKEITKGMEVLQVHFKEDTKHADTIFADPPYMVDIYRDSPVQQTFVERLSVHYQHQTYNLPESTQMIVFGHNDHYKVN